MKVLFILYSLLTVESLKFCSNCKFYRPWIEWPADKTMGKCTYFPIVYKESYNLVSGELIESASDYEFCGKARIYENLCGKSGKYYTPNSSGDRRSLVPNIPSGEFKAAPRSGADLERKS